MADVLLYFYFEDSTNKDGEPGLTVTADIWRVLKSDGTTSQIVTSGSCTEIGGGLYRYRYAGGDLSLYDYPGIGKTAASTVSRKHVPSLRWDGAEQHVTALAHLDADISSRLAANAAVLAYLDAAVSSRLATAGYSAPLSGAQTAAAILDALAASYNTAGTFGALLNLLAGIDPLTTAETAAAMLNAVAASYNTPGTIGYKINAAGASADPLLNAVPGAYSQGSAGWALGRIGAGQIVTSSPVAATGSAETYQGADYKADNGNALEWTNAAGTWADLTGATITILIGGPTQGIVQLSGSVVVPTGAGQKVRCEPTAVETAQLPVGVHEFQAWATLAGSEDSYPLLSGAWTSKRRLGL